MPGKSKKGGGLETRVYAMQMGSNSKVSETIFKEKDQDNMAIASGRAAGLYNRSERLYNKSEQLQDRASNLYGQGKEKKAARVENRAIRKEKRSEKLLKKANRS